MQKPGDVYVGAIDLFSILLPGALLTFALASVEAIGNYPPVHAVLESDGSGRWVAFAFTSYALGHLLFMVSGRLDAVYDVYRRWRWPKDQDHCFTEARDLRCAYFGNGCAPDDDNPMNTFKWAKGLLMLRAPTALGEVQRYEADSKFFRSMVVALPLIALIFAGLDQWPITLVAGVGTAFAFVCYAEVRHKSTEWAYRYVLILDRLPANAATSEASKAR